MKEIIVAKSAGFCFGVNRAVTRAQEFMYRKDQKTVTYGELIHNPDVLKRLEDGGICRIDNISQVEKNTRVIIRAHGIGQSIKDAIVAMGGLVEDMTCPFVARIQQLAAKASEEKRAFIIAGDDGHPEVNGIRGHYFLNDFYVISSENDAKKLFLKHDFSSKSPILAAQTTFNEAIWKNICKEFRKKDYTNAEIFDTICFATYERQLEAEQLAARCDGMIVIGGRNSANTVRLYEICRSRCENTVLIQDVSELCVSKFKNNNLIGITAGASTPVWIIEEVVFTMEENIKNMEAQEEMSFEEALNESFKTVRRGEIVTGIIMAVMPNEIQVDVGAKYTGILPTDELSASFADVAAQFKVGDTIEAQVIKTNDVEGTATLSRKRMEAQKAWQQISDAEESGAILAGKISSAVNGGVVVTYESNRIFIPASQITSDREADLSLLVGQTVQFKIIEVDKRRRRVIGSVKRASSEMRKEAREKILAEIEVGKHYEGTVRSLTSYGAFVDIGGVDGMVHITELSWSKLRHPNEVVNVGDVIDVYVKDFNEETGRISLGYKDPNANPMDTFRNNYNVDDIVDAKIVKLMKYGAFAEIIPGIDGLIHISEIAPEHIEKVSDKLKVGDVVSAKIIEIDFERNRISLSIKAALPVEETEEAVAVEETVEEAPVEE